MKEKLIIFLSLIYWINLSSGGVLEESIEEVKIFLYGIAAGIAALLLVIYGLKIKISSSPVERKEAKKAIIYLILGLVLIIIASGLVELIYEIPPKPPTPKIINAKVSLFTNPQLSWDNQTKLQFEFENSLGENLTQVKIEVSSLKYGWCDEDLSNYLFPSVGIIYPGDKKFYSYDNFCENSTQLAVLVKSKQNWWNFCLECPSAPGGNCQVTLGNC